MSSLSLKSLLVPTKEIEVEYPGMPGFKLKLAFMSRETSLTIRKKATKTVFKNRQPVDEFNEDLFLDLYVQNVIKGWEGFKLAYLEMLAPVDLSGKDTEDFLEFNQENALFLVKNSSEFDAYITSFANDLGNFSTSSKSN